MALWGVSGRVCTVGVLTRGYYCLTNMRKGLDSHLVISSVMTETLHTA